MWNVNSFYHDVIYSLLLMLDSLRQRLFFKHYFIISFEKYIAKTRAYVGFVYKLVWSPYSKLQFKDF